MSERDLFIAALQITDPGERSAWLDRECGGDAALRGRIDVLLDALGKAGSLLENPVVGAGDSPQASQGSQRGLDTAHCPLPTLEEGPGTVIGSYKLLEQIGQGGFGVVFMAEQQQPMRRKVALKVLKPGMDTRQVVARFEAERQALAIMDHPNIAKVLDGGATPSGRPYFVMDLVKGVPITEFCDQNHLTPRQRLELLIPVCQAVQHAHQKGIIHRDLKPSNVLVTVHDTTPVVKVIDFGVAKALGQELTDKTLFTGFAQMIGTPLYMSPEQAGQSGLDIDTRSDIYSLGVLLYELLTGTTPFDKERFKKAAYDEIRRIIREEEPPKPSTRLSESKDSLSSISAQRQTEPAKLTKLVRGELDWIVMKALEKDRNRRYETANNFAMDLQRYLADEPVQACPPSAWYRFRKMARRNRVALVTATVLGWMLALGTLVSAWQAIRAMRAERLAHERLEAEKDARKDAEAARADEAAQRAVADQRRSEADQQRAEAHRQEKIAKEERDRAKDRELLSRRHLYAAHMHLAQHAWETGRNSGMLRLLEGQRPMPGKEDLRSFDWYYLWRLCHSGHRFTLRGHRGALRCTAFSPDGKTLATAGEDRFVKLWDVGTGRELKTLRGHTVPIESMAFSPDGKTLASGGGGPDEPGEVKSWDLSTGQVRAAIIGHARGIRSLTISRDGKFLATGSHDQTVKVWNLATNQKVLDLSVAQKKGSLYVSTGWLGSVVFSPDSKTLAAVSTAEPTVVKLWDLASGKERKALPGAYGGPIAFSPDGKVLATQDFEGPHVIKLWDAATGQIRTAFRTLAGVCSLAFSPDGKILAYGSACGDLILRNLATEDERGRGHLGTVWSLAFSPDGKTLAAAGSEGTAKVWDVSRLLIAPADLERVTIEGHLPKNATRNITVAFSSDGKMLAVGADHVSGTEPSGHTTLWKWNGQAWQDQYTLIGDIGVIWAVVFSPDDKILATGSNDGVKLWDVETGKERAFLRVPAGMYVPSVAFSPDGKTLATGAHPTESSAEPSLSIPADVKIWDVATGHELANLKGHFGDAHVAFAPDGKMLAVGGHASAVTKLWSTATWQTVVTLSGVQRALFSLDGKLWGVRRRVEILEFPDWKSSDINVIAAKVGPAPIGAPVDSRGLPFAPDGKTLVAWNWGDHLKLWDAATGEERLTLRKPVGHTWSVAFSRDGTAFAAVGDGKTVNLWHAATEQDVLAQSSVNLALQASNFHLNRAATNTRSGHFREAIADFDKALELDAHGPVAHNNLAWLLATCPDPKLRDVDRAVTLAKKAVELAPQTGTYWNTLGVANYRVGDWKAAISSLEKSMELRKGGDNFDWFFLAMAHWQLGNKEQARTWYDQAVQWTKKNKPEDEELRRFRAEAAELLGLAKPPPKKQDDSKVTEK